MPPANIPDQPSAPALNLAPANGPSSAPNIPSAITQPPVAAVPAPEAAQPLTIAPGGPPQGTLSLSARYETDQPVITGGLIWRIYSAKPDDSGAFKLVREERSASPNVPLPPGNYIVHVALGLVSDVRPVSLKAEAVRETFLLPAGALRFEGRVGTTKIPSNQITFSIYKGSQFEGTERPPIVSNVSAGEVVLIPEGTYYVISNYGDANSIVRSDIRVQNGKLSDVTINHRAAMITLKLVGAKGGEALANTAWSILTPGGDVIKESIGAFPRVVLSEGEYRTVAKNDGRVYEHGFKVMNGVDGDVEVITR